jgi:hypothetical protein
MKGSTALQQAVQYYIPFLLCSQHHCTLYISQKPGLKSIRAFCCMPALSCYLVQSLPAGHLVFLLVSVHFRLVFTFITSQHIHRFPFVHLSSNNSNLFIFRKSFPTRGTKQPYAKLTTFGFQPVIEMAWRLALSTRKHFKHTTSLTNKKRT